MSFIELLVVGILLHLFADFFLQSEWQAINKARLRREPQEASEPYISSRKTFKGTTTIDYAAGMPAEATELVIPRDAYKPKWWDRHPAAYVHAGIHTVIQLLIFPLWAALLIGFLHLVIDSRTPLTKWKQWFAQTIDPQGFLWINPDKITPEHVTKLGPPSQQVPYFGMGTHVAIWQDQTAHFMVILLAAVLVSPW